MRAFFDTLNVVYSNVQIVSISRFSTAIKNCCFCYVNIVPVYKYSINNLNYFFSEVAKKQSELQEICSEVEAEMMKYDFERSKIQHEKTEVTSTSLNSPNFISSL